MGASLRPCPFCGGSAIMYEHDPYRGELGNHKQITVLCTGCGARIVKATAEEAAKAWNCRVKEFTAHNDVLDSMRYGMDFFEEVWQCNGIAPKRTNNAP